jgi:hypothetical protein
VDLLPSLNKTLYTWIIEVWRHTPITMRQYMKVQSTVTNLIWIEESKGTIEVEKR